MELAKECKKCLYEKEIKRAENIKNLLERKQYIKEVEYALEHLSFDSPPEYIDCFLKIYKNSGQEVQSYKKLKEKYNIKMQQKVKEFEEEINQSENPLKLAIQLAIVGNYIDCIAMPTIAGTSLHLLSDELKKKFYKADMIISKGQGNYETLSGSGLNIYYLFLCKCNHLQKIFLAKFLDPIFSMECERR